MINLKRKINTITLFAFTHGTNPEFEAKMINAKFKELDKQNRLIKKQKFKKKLLRR